MDINVRVKRSNLGNLRKFTARISEINSNLLKVKGYTLDADRAELREMGRYNGFTDFVIDNISDAQWKEFIKEAYKMLTNKDYVTEEELIADQCNLLHMDLGIEEAAVITDVFCNPVAVHASTTVSGLQALHDAGLTAKCVYSDMREEFLYADGDKRGYSLDRRKFDDFLEKVKDVLHPLGFAILTMREEDLDSCLTSIREQFGLYHVEHRLETPGSSKLRNKVGKTCTEITVIVTKNNQAPVLLDKVEHTGLLCYYKGKNYICRQLKEITDGKGRSVYSEASGIISGELNDSVIRNYALRQGYNKEEYQEYKEGKRNLEDVTLVDSVEWMNDFNHREYKKLVDRGIGREKAYNQSWKKEEEGYVYYRPHFKTGWSIQAENMQKKIDVNIVKNGMIRVLFDVKNNQYLPVQLTGIANVSIKSEKEKLLRNEGCMYEATHTMSSKVDYNGSNGDKSLISNDKLHTLNNTDIKNGDRLGVVETLFGFLNPDYIGDKEVSVLITHGHGGQAQIELDRLNGYYKDIHFNTIAIYADSAMGEVSGTGKFKENAFRENMDNEGVDYLLMDVVNTTKTDYYTNPDKLGYTLAKEIIHNFYKEKGVTYILPQLLDWHGIAVNHSSVLEMCKEAMNYTSLENINGGQVMVNRHTHRFIMDYCVYNFMSTVDLKAVDEIKNLTVMNTKN